MDTTRTDRAFSEYFSANSTERQYSVIANAGDSSIHTAKENTIQSTKAVRCYTFTRAIKIPMYHLSTNIVRGLNRQEYQNKHHRARGGAKVEEFLH